ncbi:hypothetical protein HDU93_009141 [Gonapodya sp. JEL0774]|nr:hypothetical protein HDU93_009141 [Gonapodya sp. JEL0774]
MSVNLNTYARELDDVYKKVFNEKDATNWACFTLVGDRNELKVQASGDGGLEELADEFSDGKIQFAICRVKDDDSSLPKVVFVAWCGDGVPVGKKGLILAGEIQTKIFHDFDHVLGFHVQINARNTDDVEPKAIMKKVHDASGAKYSIHNEPPQKMEAPKPVGSVYQKVVPVIPKRTEPEPPVAPVGTNFQRPQLPPPKKLSSNIFGQQSDGDRKIQEERARREEEDRKQREREAEHWKRSGGDQSDSSSKPQGSRNRAEEEIAAARKAAKPEDVERDDKPKYLSRNRAEEEIAAARRAAQADDVQRDEKPQYLSRNRAEQEIAAARKAAAASQDNPDREEKPLDAAALRRKELEELRSKAKREEQDDAKRRDEAEAERRSRDAREVRAREQAEKEATENRKREEERLTRENRRKQEEEAERARAAEILLQKEAEERRRVEDERRRAVETEAAAAALSTPKHAPTAAAGLTANALYEYTAAEDNELTFAEGDKIVSIEKVSEDWWSGINSKTGQAGLFPSNYVELTEEASPAPAFESRIAPPPREPEPEPEPAPAAAPIRPPPSPASSAAAEGLTATALYDYEAAEDNELTFTEGAKITHIDKVSDDWWSGKNSQTGQTGLFPCNYVELN